jgi:endonuclease/exonuclease/phosphatase family metal-dependent hydrolase
MQLPLRGRIARLVPFCEVGVKVMTLNIWNYTRPWMARRQQIVSLLQVHQPDAVALQETRHDFRFERGKGQGEQIAELAGYHATSAVGQVYFPLLRVDEGLTILTRQPPERVIVRQLTRLPRERRDENQRICLGVEMLHDAHRVYVFDTHFSVSPVARVRNAVEVARFIREQSSDQPAVLMGDLNAEPDSLPVQFLLGQDRVDGESGDFVDCWVQANAHESGYTDESFNPRQRIDYILARNLPDGVRRASIVGGEPVDGIYLSDHLAVVAELAL